MKLTLKRLISPGIPLAVLLILACLSIWAFSYFNQFDSPMPEGCGLMSSLHKTNTSDLLPLIISVVFTLVNGFLLIHLNTRYTIIRTRTFLPVLIFLLLISSWYGTHMVACSHVVLTLNVLALYLLFDMYRKPNASEQSFMSSFLIASGSLMINSSLLLIPVFWIGLAIFNSFSLRTFLASLFGAIAPWVLYSAVMYYLQPNLQWLFNIQDHFILQSALTHLPVYKIVYTAILAAIILLGIFGLFNNIQSDAVHTRAKLRFLVVLFISTAIITLLLKNQFALYLPLLGLLYAIIVSHPFTLYRSKFYVILFIVFCIVNILYVAANYFVGV